MGASTVAEDVEYDRHDDGMDEDGQVSARALPVPHIVTPAAARPARGRFLGRSASVLASSRDRFDSVPVVPNSPHGGPQRPIEGWILLVSGVKEDAEESDLYDAFADFGHVKDLHVNLERRTGYGKGYALVEYESFEEAQTAIRAMNGKQLLTKTIHVDWFNRGPIQKVVSTRTTRNRGIDVDLRSPLGYSYGPNTRKQALSTPSSAASDVKAQRRLRGGTGATASTSALLSPTARVYESWGDTETALLYKYCAEIKSCLELTEACYEIVTQRLCASGVLRSISSVKNKIRNTKRVYEFWKNVMMDPAIVKDEAFWHKHRQFHALKNGPPKHLNLMKIIFEPPANWKGVPELAEHPAAAQEHPATVQPADPVQSLAPQSEASVIDDFLRFINEPTEGAEGNLLPETLAATLEENKAIQPDVQKPDDSKQSQLFELHGEVAAEFCFLVDDLKKLCLVTDKVEKAAQLVSVNSEQEKIDNIDIENVDQLISAYNLALAAVKKKTNRRQANESSSGSKIKAYRRYFPTRLKHCLQL